MLAARTGVAVAGESALELVRFVAMASVVGGEYQRGGISVPRSRLDLLPELADHLVAVANGLGIQIPVVAMGRVIGDAEIDEHQPRLVRLHDLQHLGQHLLIVFDIVLADGNHERRGELLAVGREGTVVGIGVHPLAEDDPAVLGSPAELVAGVFAHRRHSLTRTAQRHVLPSAGGDRAVPLPGNRHARVETLRKERSVFFQLCHVGDQLPLGVPERLAVADSVHGDEDDVSRLVRRLGGRSFGPSDGSQQDTQQPFPVRVHDSCLSTSVAIDVASRKSVR